ncbi:MAG: TonB-dependent receptor [Gemmatimonadota bacterium]|nr:TonB-dependent receptor [Gemmatimonadota bacterium]
MRIRSRLEGLVFVAFAVLVIAAVFVPAGAQAQQGTITGQVTDAETGAPVSDAAVEALGAAGPVASNAEGRFSLAVAAGTHSVVVTVIGYETTRLDGIQVDAGGTANVDISIRSQALLLNPVVVTASRRQEKALDAPASIATVSEADVARIAAVTVAEHVKTLPGVDAVQTGIAQGTLVARGFNNVFSGTLLTIIDNRYARVPSLRFNAYQMLPTTDLDIDRIEFSLGPGAALYGPNASNGVMHIITSSPIDRQGTTISLAGGERSVFHGQFRTSHSPSESFGLKISGQYQRGTDWEYDDLGEAQARMAGCSICTRNYDSERYSADARLDFRFAGDGSFIVNGGTSVLASGVDMTGIGAFQVKNWAYNFAQARLSKGRLFAQAFLNMTDSGGDPNAPAQDGTFGLRTGAAVVDQSRTMAAQFQYGFDIGSWQSFTYGVDWQRTDPRTGGTIFGRNENDDMISEVGTYLHSETSLGDRIDLVTAIRLDDHNRLTDVNISPRAALVFRPADDQNFRFTYNRAFATPTTTNLFLDIIAAQIPLSPLPIAYNIRALGVPSGGFTFSAQCPGGLMSYCMRSPFAPGQPLPANAAALWAGLLDMLPAILPANFVPFADLLKNLLQSPGALPGDPAIGTVLRRLNQAAIDPADAFPLDNSPVESIADLTSTINNTYEVGYKGLINDRVLLSADVYFSRVENFVGPLRVVTPNVFFDPESTTAFVVHRLAPLIQAGLVTLEQLKPIVEGVAQLPLGTIVPDQVDAPDLLVTYRNFGEVDFWGADLSAQILASDRLRISASYSFQSDECFDFNQDGGCTTSDDIALNAPSHKGSVGFVFDDQTSGFSFGGRMRMTTAFPMNSGVYIGNVDGYSVLDASIGYRLPFQPGTHVSLTANNLLNNLHQEFVGAPEIGRMLLARVRYDF